MDVTKVSRDESFFSFLPGVDRGESIIDPEEVAALLKFATEKGIEDETLVPALFNQLRMWQGAREAGDAADQESATTEMLASYTKLTKQLNGVNGRNILQGRNLMKETLGFMFVTFVFFIVCVTTLALQAWVSNEPRQDDVLLNDAILHYIQFFTPFFWGALGACVYILKRITDEAADNRFDHDKFQGWATRATLGGVLGGIITYIIDPSAFGDLTLNIAAIAFLTGLGTKVVYGALQRLIQILGDKMNLQVLREQKSKTDRVTEFIAKQLADTDPDTEADKYKILTELLNTRVV
jgi:hypothetical protein